eukprot:1976937-Pleurochrysis_carterae.AAC.5
MEPQPASLSVLAGALWLRRVCRLCDAAASERRAGARDTHTHAHARTCARTHTHTAALIRART